jgi:YD repeat-containing protein
MNAGLTEHLRGRYGTKCFKYFLYPKHPFNFLAHQVMITVLLSNIFSGHAALGQYTRVNEPGPVPAIQVNTYTGNLFYQRTDLFIPARGTIPMNISFVYNSLRADQDQGYGKGWSFSFGMFYRLDGSDVVIVRSDGREDDFSFSGGVYRAPAGVYDTLTLSGGAYCLVTKYGVKYYFNDPAHKQLTSVVDRNGNTTSMTYSSGKPVKITDPSGRFITLDWSGDHLSQITDPNTTPERVISFQYDISWNITSVIRPLSNTYNYDYDGLGQMIAVTDPRSTEIIISNNDYSAVDSISCAVVNYFKAFE